MLAPINRYQISFVDIYLCICVGKMLFSFYKVTYFYIFNGNFIECIESFSSINDIVLTNSMAYGTPRSNAAFTRALK